MSKVVSRTFASVPARSAHDTWEAISHLLTRRASGAARDELKAVAGIAASLIADQSPKDAPIVVTCDGPRTRVYCVYDDRALEGDANEEPLGFDPLEGEWAISLPCDADDLDWVQASLARQGTRITARDKAVGFKLDEAAAAMSGLELDVKAFLGS